MRFIHHAYCHRFLLVVGLMGLFAHHSHAQSKASLRYEIDAKRGGMAFNSKDALPRGREFKRIDSSYYVGWMFEGAYKFEHAADHLGFKAAAEQLDKAMKLMDIDFRLQIRTRTADVLQYISIMKFHRDWDFIAYALMNCYSNMDRPDLVWEMLQRCKKADLQDEIYMETFHYLAWTVHRNRFYTSDKYPFLKNSIDENEQYANKLLDSSALKIKRDGNRNKTIFSADYVGTKMPGVWHYKSILYSYQLNIESGAYYYEKLRSTPQFPANNYATFCGIQGKFKEAEFYYDQAKKEDPGDKRMKESYYYLSIINQYKATPKKGIAELKDLLKANGSTPGFGWYNMALARDLLYDGEISIAKRYAERAEQFQEIHIGTTLGQSHYDFTASLLKLMVKMKEIESVKFLNQNWWYSPNDLSRLAQLTIEKYGLQFLIINQFASNPERDRVIYKLFSTESTVSFDEVWHLIDGFSTNYFLERYTEQMSSEKRYQIKRYHKLFAAKLLMKKGEYRQASAYLESILNEIQLDAEYEKLLLARVYESLIICKKELKETSGMKDLGRLFYQHYPQLIPFSGYTMPMQLHTNAGANEKDIIDVLKKANIEWVKGNASDIPQVYITFTQKDKLPIIQLKVDYNGETVVPLSEFTYKDPKLAGEKLCYAIFDIGDDDKGFNMK
ncbi:MAG: hypothetical protein JNJ58_10665 [Chitinophagaceae bacterium]|nr:hypothetical protein [Chitinophagaceae bacterium]